MHGDYRSAGDNTMIVEDVSSRPKPSVIVVGFDQYSVIFDAVPHHLYQITKLTSAEKLFEHLRLFLCDIVIVDALLEGLDSISLIKALVVNGDRPMLLVRSDTNEEIDRVLSLELGADDCVAFSCGAREIRARVGALLRRCATKTRSNTEVRKNISALNGSELTYCGWILNRDRCQLYSPAGDALSLTNVEYGILIVLFSDPGIVRDRSALRNIDAGDEEYEFRSLDVCLSRLRKKMEKLGGQDLIETVRGRGYRLAAINKIRE